MNDDKYLLNMPYLGGPAINIEIPLNYERPNPSQLGIFAVPRCPLHGPMHPVCPGSTYIDGKIKPSGFHFSCGGEINGFDHMICHYEGWADKDGNVRVYEVHPA